MNTYHYIVLLSPLNMRYTNDIIKIIRIDNILWFSIVYTFDDLRQLRYPIQWNIETIMRFFSICMTENVPTSIKFLYEMRMKNYSSCLFLESLMVSYSQYIFITNPFVKVRQPLYIFMLSVNA